MARRHRLVVELRPEDRDDLQRLLETDVDTMATIISSIDVNTAQVSKADDREYIVGAVETAAVFYIYRYGSFQEIKMTAQKNQKWYGIPIPYHFGPENQDVVLATTVVHTACRTRARRGAPASAATRAHTDPATPCQCSHCITVHAHSLRRGRGRDERAGCEETGRAATESRSIERTALDS